MMKKKTKTVLKIAVAVMGVFAMGYAVTLLIFLQLHIGPVLSVVPSPELPETEVWLLEEGFIDRGIYLYVKSPSVNNGKPKYVTPLDWDGLYYFKQLRWSEDGRLAVFSIHISDFDSPEVNAFAFDFATGKAVLPPWQGRNSTSKKTIDEWKKHEQSIMATAERHKGLTNARFDHKSFRDKSHKIWFWQVPEG